MRLFSYEVAPPQAGLATLEARRADEYFKFVEGIQSLSPIVQLFSYEGALAEAGLATLEARRPDPYFKFIAGIQS